MPRIKKQHYVPQSALRRFSTEGERIFVFDKIRRQIRLDNIRDVAQQRYFYDIPQEAIPRDLEVVLDRQMIEHTLGELESDFNVVADEVISKTTNRNVVHKFLNTLRRGKIISRKNKRALSFFVALQYLRTREFRRTIQDGLEQFELALRNRVPEDQVEKFFEGFRGVTDANIRMYHLSMMFDSDFVGNLTEMLYRHILVIGSNNGEHKLYTSDNPMVRQPHRRHPFLGNAGIGSPGIEIAMPITSRQILVFMERTHFVELSKWDRKIVELEPEHVDYYNSLQVRGCDRQVYCADDDFDVAREFCQRWPERCAEERRRIVVE